MATTKITRKSMRRGISKETRAAFKAWETRRELAAKRSKAAKKAAATRKRNARNSVV